MITRFDSTFHRFSTPPKTREHPRSHTTSANTRIQGYRHWHIDWYRYVTEMDRLQQPYTRAVRTSAFTIIRFTNTLAIALHAPALHTQRLTKTLATALYTMPPPAPTLAYNGTYIGIYYILVCVGSGLIMVVAPHTSSYQATNDKLVHHNYSPTV